MKYMGSKNRIAKYILPIILKDRKEGQWYVEPFVGGANMIDKVSGDRIGADNNEYLIALLIALQNDIEVPNNINKKIYDDVRLNKDKYDKWYVGMIGFGYTYSAKWFGGFIGNVNDIVCKSRDRIGESYRAILKRKNGLDNIILKCSSYTELYIPNDSIIYCDPPYANTTKYKDSFNHDEFWEWCRSKSKEGHQIFVSEYSAPSDFKCIWSKEINSSLTKNTSAKKGIEKLFIYKP